MGKSSPSDFIINEPCLPKLHERSILFKSENQLEFWYRDIDRQQFDEQEIVRISNLLKFIKPSNAICSAGLPPTIDASNAASSTRRYWFHAGAAFDRVPIAYLPNQTPKEIIEDALGCLAAMHDVNLIHGAICSDTVYMVPKPAGLECRQRLAIFCDPVAISVYKSVNVQDSPLLETARIGDGMPSAFQDVVSLILLFAEVIIPGEVPRKDRKVDLRQLQQVLSSKNKKDEDPFTDRLISLIDAVRQVPVRKQQKWTASNALEALRRREIQNDPTVLLSSRWTQGLIAALLIFAITGTILILKHGRDFERRLGELDSLNRDKQKLESEKENLSGKVGQLEKKVEEWKRKLDPPQGPLLQELAIRWESETKDTPLSTREEVLSALNKFADGRKGQQNENELLKIINERKQLFEKELPRLELWEDIDPILKVNRLNLAKRLWNDRTVESIAVLTARLASCEKAYKFWKDELVKKDLKSLLEATVFVNSQAKLDQPTKELVQEWIDKQNSIKSIMVSCEKAPWIQVRSGDQGWTELRQINSIGVEIEIMFELRSDFQFYAKYNNWYSITPGFPSSNRRNETGVFGLWKLLNTNRFDLEPFGTIKVEPTTAVFPPLELLYGSAPVASAPNPKPNQGPKEPGTGNIEIGLPDLKNQQNRR